MSELPRSTDAPGAAPTNVITCVADIARVPRNRIHCGYCSASFPENETEAYRTHRCTDPAGRDYAPLKAAAAEGRRLAREQLRNYPVPPCLLCGRTGMKPGDVHTCNPTPSSGGPHSIEALNRANRLASLKADLAALERAEAAEALHQMKNEEN